MKIKLINSVILTAGTLALATLCRTASATPVETNQFLKVDINGANGPNEASFQSWAFASSPGANLFTNTFSGVTVVLEAHSSNGQTAQTRNRGSMSGQAWANLLNDFFYCPRNTAVGYGAEYVALTFSGLAANTNYEITVWNYDQNDPSTATYMAWGIVSPTNNPNYQPVPGGGGLTPKRARVHMTGPWPSGVSGDTNVQEFVYSASFYVTADGSGNATIYGWNDSDSYPQTQIAYVNGFMIGGPTTNSFVPPVTNTITTLVNPVPTAYGPPTVWPYTAGIAIPTDGTYTDESFTNGSTIMGETFKAFRDFKLRNFYLALKSTTNSGQYLAACYDLGTNAPANSLTPGASNNLFANLTASPQSYWGFNPGFLNITNNPGIVKFKFNAVGDQPACLSGHYYFLGLIYVPGSGSNDLVWKRTTSGATYANGSAYKGSAASVANTGFGGTRNFIMAIDVLNPNLVIDVTNATLASTWPTLATTVPGTPVMATYNNPFSGTLGLNDDPVNDNAMGPANTAVPVGLANGLNLSMSFYATNTFNLGAVAFRQRGLGSSNVLFTLAIWDVTNTFFTATDSIEHWPRNFQPNIDTDPKGIPIFKTNVDFYYTADNGRLGAGLGTNDQVLILSFNNPAYQVPIQNNHHYAVEISADTTGQNANTDGLFQLVRDIDGLFQKNLFPDLGDGIQTLGKRTNSASAGIGIVVSPRMLRRTYNDPETFAGDVVGSDGVRDVVMAIYAVPAQAQNITITSVSRSGNNVTLTWNSTGGTYSVLRKINLTDATWTTLATGLSSPTYTDTTASAVTGFYRVSSP
jgi:hypothetical protein